eukprot:TRINITY_DN23716_c0_g1_i1.p1 TRINITY_DN23716_c0_g1~~TRINITY_DN23716_c0_g1_i1.p1  ORF type:complete len:137 (+),score=29.41 TRINITY_DN23716_c0_g1_i1:25-435(+)
MNTADKSIATVKTFFGLFKAGSTFSDVEPFLHPEATLQILPLTLKAPKRNRQEVIPFWKEQVGIFKKFEITPLHVFASADGSHVHTKAKSKGETKNGTPYGQEYSITIELRDGLIYKIEEFVDSLYSAQFFAKAKL